MRIFVRLAGSVNVGRLVLAESASVLWVSKCRSSVQQLARVVFVVTGCISGFWGWIVVSWFQVWASRS